MALRFPSYKRLGSSDLPDDKALTSQLPKKTPENERED